MKTLLTLASMGVAFAAAALLLAGVLTFAPQQAQATPAFAQQTSKPCGFCHTTPPTLNSRGKKFKADGNKL